MNSREGPKDSVRPIKFGKGRKEKLRKYLETELAKAITDREPKIQKCKAWVEQANSRRKRKDTQSGRDSNIDIPLTRVRMMQNSARLKNPLFQHETLFVGVPRNSRSEELARSVERVNDYITDQIDYLSLTDEWIEQFQTFPKGIIKTPFITETERACRWEEIGLDSYNMALLNEEGGVVRRKLEDGSTKYFQEVDDTSIVRQGAFPEVVPYEDFFHPSTARDVRSADWVMHRVWLTKPAVDYKIRAGIYDKKDGDQDVKAALANPSEVRDKLMRSADEGKGHGDPSNTKQYEIMEAYLSWDCKGGGEPTEIIVTFDRKSGVFLRAVYNFYHEYKRPFVTHNYKSKCGSIDGDPLTYILEPIHIATSASFNQRLDAASRALETGYIVPPGSNITAIASRDGIRTAFYEGTVDRNEIVKLEFSQPFTQAPQLEDNLKEYADQLTALNPYSWGHEQTSRPNMTGQMQLIEEGKQPQYDMLESFRASLAEVSKHVLARHRQFYPEGLRYYIMQEDEEGQKLTEEFFSWPEGLIEKDVIIETRVSSSSMSKSMRKQELVALVDKVPQIYQTMIQMVQAATDPQGSPPMQAAAFRMLVGMQTAVDKMFTEFEVGKKEIINPENLVKEMQIAQQWQQRFEEMGQQIQQLQQQGQAVAGQLEQEKAKNAQLQAGIQAQGAMAGPPQQAPGLPGAMPQPMPGPGPRPV